MNLLNIYNDGRNIYLFGRDGKTPTISTDNSFHPFYYEPDAHGKCNSYDGKSLRKITVHHPADVIKNRSALSYSSDIHFTKNYMIHKINELTKTNIKYFFLDIEILAKDIPDVRTAKQPISCISIYNSESDSVATFWLKDYPGALEAQETALIKDFLAYMIAEKPDLWLSWNVDFDYGYLHNRIPEFASIISPINKTRSGSSKEIQYPAGMSIMDYLPMFKKVFMREPSYTLDAVCQKYLKDESWGESDFGVLTDDIKAKNINDVIRLKNLEKKFKLIEYFDEIRRLTKSTWEELYHNSFVIENLLLIEAHKKDIVLPNRPAMKSKEERDAEEEGFEGAAREAAKTGALYDIGKFDLTSAYPNMITNFCLDTTNIVEDDSGIDVDGTKFQQDPEALLPTMVRNILQLKDNLKQELKGCKYGSEEYDNTKIKYDAIKGVVNSAFGVMGFSSFRLFDNRIASAITYLVRDLLLHVRGEVASLGYEVIYWDTDSTFIATKEDLSVQLNDMIQTWAKTKYGKPGISLGFEYEGYFDKIFIIALCRYIGNLVTKKGMIQELKGVEAKRASSSKYEGQFQLQLIDKILNRESREAVIEWILQERKKIQTLPIEEVAFPTKISNKQYAINKKTGKQTLPIFVRAVNNTNFIKKLKVAVGEVLYWAYVKPVIRDANGTEMNVFAFTKDDKSVITKQKIDWDEMTRRNINQKVDTVFVANAWSTQELHNVGQLQLF